MTPPTLQVHAATDRGRKRSENEDSHAIWIPGAGSEGDRRGVLLVVADGMGGALAGGVASRLAVETVLDEYRSGDPTDPGALLRTAVLRANQVVHERSRSRADCVGMGTTLTTLAVHERKVWLAHVGDSRAYLIRAARALPLTEDHSLVAALVRQNQLTPEQARADIRRNVVTRGVGINAEVEVDSGPAGVTLEPGDTLLLCSDGLHGLVDDRELGELASRHDLEPLGAELIELANRRGGPDNITVVLARLPGAAQAAPPEGREAATGEAPGRPAPAHAEPAGATGRAAAASTPLRVASGRVAASTDLAELEAYRSRTRRRHPRRRSMVVMALLALALAAALLATLWRLDRGPGGP